MEKIKNNKKSNIKAESQSLYDTESDAEAQEKFFKILRKNRESPCVTTEFNNVFEEHESVENHTVEIINLQHLDLSQDSQAISDESSDSTCLVRLIHHFDNISC